ncbi:MAG: hypothetical protein ABH804_02745 [archaeon]
MNKRVYGIVICIFLVVILGLNFISAANFFTDIINPIRNYFGNVGNSEVFAQFLIFIIIVLFVFSLLDTTGFLKNKGILFVISLAVGALSTYYMTEQNILTIKLLYQSFGGALVTLVPFVAIAGFTFRAVKNGNVQLLVVQHVAWGIFAAFLLYTMVVNWSTIGFGGVTTEFDSGGNFSGIMFIVFFLIALTLAIFNSFFVGLLSKTLLKAKTVAAAKTMDDIRTGMDVLTGTGRHATGS